jgi:hypothetical protein
MIEPISKVWLPLVDHSFLGAPKPFRRTNSDFFSKSHEKSNSGPFPSSPVNAGCARYSVVCIRLIGPIQSPNNDDGEITMISSLNQAIDYHQLSK